MYMPRDAVVGELEWARGAFDPIQIELVAARTSLHNECFS